MTEKTKQCNKCRQQKSLFEFHRNNQTKDGFRFDCKKCRNSHYKKYYQIHKSENAARCKKYQQTHIAQLADYDKKYQKTFMGYLRKRFTTIKQRCSNPKKSNYKYYGGRGIKCKFKSADEFIDYVLNELRVNPKGLTVDRIDNNGNYEKGNIRFVTMKVNANNRRKK